MGRLAEFLRHLSPSDRASVKAAKKVEQETIEQKENEERNRKINQEIHALHHKEFKLGCQAIEQLEIQKKLEAIFSRKTDKEYKIYQEPIKHEDDPFFSRTEAARITIAIPPLKKPKNANSDDPPEQFKTLHVYGSVIINNDGAIFPGLCISDGESIDSITLKDKDYDYKSTFKESFDIRPMYTPNKIEDLEKDLLTHIDKVIEVRDVPEIEAWTNTTLEKAVENFFNPPKLLNQNKQT
jgi:hypothetical protein